MSDPTLVADPPRFFIPYAIDLSIDGLMLASFIGLSILRCWLYTKSSDEKWPLQSFVAASIIAEIAHTVVNWNIERGNFAVNKAISNYMVGAGFMLCIQAFLAARIHYAGLIHRFVPMIVLCTALFAFAASKYGNNFQADPPSPAASWVSNPVFVNGMLAHTFFSMMSEAVVPATVAWSLGRPDEYGVKKTTPMLEKLLYYVIARGILVMLAHLFFLFEYPVHLAVVILTSHSNFQSLDLMELSDRIRANARSDGGQRPQPVVHQQNGASSSSQEGRARESPSPSTDTTKNKAEKVSPEENA